MNEWIILMALVVAALSLAAIGLICCRCRQMEREKNRGLVQAVREQDRIARELEQARIEKKTLERILETKLTATAETSAAKKKTILKKHPI
ncbi:hypothetical protein [uncultured Alistipes sp.]|uniref:hypothetical protein n=1 Tax=uncultured Alistipes sp. TaxID=538949 RepID=UPI0025F577A6|nr:hypothetical protein [uncultured Alistipes sp.]